MKDNNLHRLMEIIFLDLTKDYKGDRWDNGLIYFTRITDNNDFLMKYNPKKKELNIWDINEKFKKIFGINSEQSKLFIKLMIIKYFKLEIKEFLFNGYK